MSKCTCGVNWEVDEEHLESCPIWKDFRISALEEASRALLDALMSCQYSNHPPMVWPDIAKQANDLYALLPEEQGK